MAGCAKEMSVEDRENFYKNATTKTHIVDNTTPAAYLEGEDCLDGLTKEEQMVFMSIIRRQYFDRGIRIKINYGDLDLKTGELKNLVL